MIRALDVWWEGRRVGRLARAPGGGLSFSYDPSWLDDAAAPALSVSLPKRAEPFARRECRPFFGGLLPEESQREAVARVLGVSHANDFALLDALGGDVAGAIQLLAPDAEPPMPGPAACATPLDEEGLVRVLDALPARPLLAGQEGLRLSLAGAQSKVPVVLVDDAVALPVAGQPTTHILKPAMSRFPATTENEAFAMRLAAAVGLEVAAVEARVVQGRRFLLVKRYDRRVTEDGRVQRLHQEDFCQALGYAPERKYTSEGGPGLRACFELVRRVAARPAVDVLRVLDAVIFHAVVGNADAHGKNYSLLYDAAGPRFAPLYDLLSTVAYPELSPRFAMKIGRRATLEELDARGWAAFAEGAGLGAPLVRRRVAELASLVEKFAAEVAGELSRPGFDEEALAAQATLVTDRAQRCLRQVRDRAE